MSIFVENNRLFELMAELYDCLAGMQRFQDAQKSVSDFLADEEARHQYEQLLDLEEELHRKQQEGKLTENDLQAYKAVNDALKTIPDAERFFKAQRELENIHLQIMNFIGIAIETGQIPSPDEIEDFSCDNCGKCGRL